MDYLQRLRELRVHLSAEQDPAKVSEILEEIFHLMHQQQKGSDGHSNAGLDAVADRLLQVEEEQTPDEEIEPEGGD